MTDLVLYFWVVLGILISVLLPIATKWLREVTEDTSKGVGNDVMVKVWDFAKPYLKIMLASMILGLLALAVYRAGLGGDKVISTWAEGLIYGYTWDSTFQKIFTPK